MFSAVLAAVLDAEMAVAADAFLGAEIAAGAGAGAGEVEAVVASIDRVVNPGLYESVVNANLYQDVVKAGQEVNVSGAIKKGEEAGKACALTVLHEAPNINGIARSVDTTEHERVAELIIITAQSATERAAVEIISDLVAPEAATVAAHGAREIGAKAAAGFSSDIGKAIAQGQQAGRRLIPSVNDLNPAKEAGISAALANCRDQAIEAGLSEEQINDIATLVACRTVSEIPIKTIAIKASDKAASVAGKEAADAAKKAGTVKVNAAEIATAGPRPRRTPRSERRPKA